MRDRAGVLVSILSALLGSCLCGHALAEGPDIPKFVEETQSAGIASVYSGDWEHMVGGGAAAFDCNGDSYPDLMLAGGENKAAFYRNASTSGGALKFVAESSGLELTAVTGGYPLDIDNDGIMDVVLLRVGENVVMRGLGDCKFERANEAWDFAGGDAWSAAFAATWEKDATWPTIAIGNYIDRNEELSPWGSCTDNWLHRPNAAGMGFAGPLALKPSHCALSMLFTDWDKSGTPSLRISNDREYYEGGQEQLWRLDPGQTPTLYSEAEGWRYLRIWGMGIAEYDLDANGYPDYFLTSMADNRLQTLAAVPQTGRPQPSYKEIAFAKGVTAHRPYAGGDLRPSTGWHTQFEDVNNDRLVDLLIVKGNVAKMKDFAEKDPNNLLLQGADGKFVEAGDKAGIASYAIGRGGAMADFNLDGFLDLIVVNRWENAKLWRNTGGMAGNWIEFKLAQDGPNRNASGAIVEVTADGTVMRREISAGGGHASGQAGWIHFGLGEAMNAQVRIRWPHGEWNAPVLMKSNQFAIIRRGNPGPELWSPK
jgi:hypothetical protein